MAKKKHSSGNLITESDSIDNFNFDDTFDSELIANRGEGIDALSENDYVEKDFHKKDNKPVISQDELAELAKINNEAKSAAKLYSELTDDDENESSLITKEEAEKIKNIKNLYDDNLEIHAADKQSELSSDEDPSDDEDASDDNRELVYYETDDDEEEFDKIKHLLTEEEKEKYKKKVVTKKTKSSEQIKSEKIQKQKDFEKSIFESLYSDDYEKTDEYRDMIILEKQFNDLLRAPKIERNQRKSLDTNFMDSKDVKNDKKFVEISHSPNMDDPHQHDSSTVEINRDEYGEIENIVVICKCGEKTLIKFDYPEEDDFNMYNASETDDSDENNDTSEEEINNSDKLEFEELNRKFDSDNEPEHNSSDDDSTQSDNSNNSNDINNDTEL